MLRAIIWAAVSSKGQAAHDKVSIPDQVQLATTKAGEIGATVAHILTVSESRELADFSTAAQTVDAYRQLKQIADDGKADVLIFLNRGRLGRTTALVESVALYCLRHGIALYDLSSPPATLDSYQQLHGPGDQLAGIIQSWRYANELTELRRRHEMGMKNRTKRGLFPNTIPYGWVQTFDPDGTSRIVIDEVAAAAIKRIFELHITGTSLNRIADIVNSEGHKTYGKAKGRSPKPFDSDSVRRVIKNALTYAGYVQINRTGKREHIVAKSDVIPAIIDEALAQRVIDEMERRKHGGFTRGQYLYSGLVTCTQCNRRMSVSSSASNGTHRGKRYRTALVFCDDCGRRVTFDALTEVLREYLSIADHEQQPITVSDDLEALQAELAQLQSQVGRLPDALARARQLYVDGDMTKPEYDAERVRLAMRKQELEQRIRALDVEISKADVGAIRRRYEILQAAGNEMLDKANIDPAAVNQWLRTYIHMYFDMDRNITVKLL